MDNQTPSSSGEKISDPYYYTKLDEFTSEVFKIEVNNVPSKAGYVDFRKRLVSMKLKPKKIKLITSAKIAYITFASEDERLAAITELNGHSWKGQTLSAKKANPIADPMVIKRKTQDEGSEDVTDSNKKSKPNEDDSLPQNIRLNNAVSPLWQMPYSEQLKVKAEEIKVVLKRLHRQLERDFPQKVAELKQLRLTYGLHYCNLLPIVPSPVTEKYRNKCEFTIGMDSTGKDKVVGFRLGKYKGGSCFVAEPTDCIIVPDAMKSITKVFEGYLADSPYMAYDANSHCGNWRQLTVRTSRLGHIMMIPQLNSQNLTKDEIDAETERIKLYFSEDSGQADRVTSLYINVTDKQAANSGVTTDVRHLLGEQAIYEQILGLKFRISPEAFFQINTAACEVLYSLIGEWVCESSSLKETVTISQISKSNYDEESMRTDEKTILESPDITGSIEKNEDHIGDQSKLGNSSCDGNIPTESCSKTIINNSNDHLICVSQSDSSSAISSSNHNEPISNNDTDYNHDTIRKTNISPVNTVVQSISQSDCSMLPDSSNERIITHDNVSDLSNTNNDEQSLDNLSKNSPTNIESDVNEVSLETVLLDVCCGTGTIGLTLAKTVSRVIGIEMCQAAVNDACRNAQLNGITNAEFRCGKAEDLIQSTIDSLSSSNIVAVVDPPRPGLHKTVIHALRRCKKLRKLIYVSCSPQSAQSNFYDLMKPVSKRMRGTPFTISKAVPVDLFPHTNLCELVILFER